MASSSSSSSSSLPLSSGIYSRVKDVEEFITFLSPITGWQGVPLTNFKDACKNFNLQYIATHVDCALLAGENFVFENPSFLPSLSYDIRCAIPAAVHLYTQDWDDPVYLHLNGLLRNKSRILLKPHLPFLKLLYLADMAFPHVDRGSVVYRGVKKDLTANYPKGKKFRWWGVTSATLSLGTLNNPMFCGDSGERTIFAMKCMGGGTPIQTLSAVSSEDEVLLRAGTLFVVKDFLPLGPSLKMIQIEEIPDDNEESTDPVICAVKEMQSLSVNQSGVSSVLCSPVALEIVQLLNEAKWDEAFGKARANAHANGDCAGLLAVCYRKGFGTNISNEEKERWSKVAIEKGTTLGCAIGYYYLDKCDLSAPLLKLLAKERVSVAQMMLGYQFDAGVGVVKDVNETYRLYREAADQGYAPALCNLSFCYRNGIGVDVDVKKAVILYQQSADKGDSDALLNLGVCYQNGIGVDVDVKKAVSLYQQSADKGNSDALYNLGFCYRNGIGVEKNLGKAFSFYQQSADKGHAGALYALGNCFQNGTGVEKNLGKAVSCYQQSADKGHAASINYLGFCYQKGIGVDVDVKKAVSLYQQSADKGYAAALNNLGFCYQNGIGVDVDLEKAVSLYQQSSDKGNADALYRLSVCYYNGFGVEKDFEKAVSLCQQSADKGDYDALLNMGLCYEKGFVVDVDVKKAVSLYQQSADKGNSSAFFHLGVCYQDGLGVEKDLKKAFSLYQQSADNGCFDALTNLGVCYQYGYGVVKDEKKALSLYQQGAAQGVNSAEHNLGNCYFYGWCGVAKDEREAMEYYKLSAEHGNEEAAKKLQNLRNAKNSKKLQSEPAAVNRNGEPVSKRPDQSGDCVIC